MKYFKNRDWFFWTIASLIIITIAMITFAIFYGSQKQDTLKRNCESVGGHVEVVETQFTGKTTVNIYGCVK